MVDARRPLPIPRLRNVLSLFLLAASAAALQHPNGKQAPGRPNGRPVLGWMNVGMNGKFSGGSRKKELPGEKRTTVGAADDTLGKLQDDLARLQGDLDKLDVEQKDWILPGSAGDKRRNWKNVQAGNGNGDAEEDMAGGRKNSMRYVKNVPGAGVYGEETDEGFVLLGNAPYGNPQRPKSDVFCGMGWGYGLGCTLGPFFGTGAGISVFPPGPIYGAGGGCGLVCGVGLSTGFFLGIGNAFVAYGFNEPLTMAQRYYGMEQWAEDKMIETIEWCRQKKRVIDRMILERRKKVVVDLQLQIIEKTGKKSGWTVAPEDAKPRQVAADKFREEASAPKALTASGYMASLRENKDADKASTSGESLQESGKDDVQGMSALQFLVSPGKQEAGSGCEAPAVAPARIEAANGGMRAAPVQGAMGLVGAAAAVAAWKLKKGSGKPKESDSGVGADKEGGGFGMWMANLCCGGVPQT